ncbi:MAG: Glycosyltransferase [Candidatus Daviesbacteria bacterium GW2011_GWA2_38_24]|uniref:Glycosyltransferase n=1 Tax=Candidatus Daviesbacteria bacterium GW2011_GWA2_38_24 TaxID=1618422 RepID=A0A0G0JHW9_9BACT|nr:MAG: Glycosyltransferase [Candidatus Daviesbacteria bacterium GW2011_GWA2_38_24]
MKIDSLSVFFPAYNEEDNIKATVEQALQVLEKLKISQYEVLVVDDASRDGTTEIVKQLALKDKHVKLIQHKINAGYGGALKTGFKHSNYAWVAFADSDGQFDFREITKFLEKTGQADLILGYRLNRADPFIRKVLTFGWKTIALILLGLTAKDYSCGFKLVKRKVFDAVQPLESEEKVTQIEFLVKAKRKGYKFAEVGVHHYPRKFGSPTGGSLFSKVFLKSILDLFKLRWKLR